MVNLLDTLEQMLWAPGSSKTLRKLTDNDWVSLLEEGIRGCGALEEKMCKANNVAIS